ncbi:BTB/POZ protein [Roridomyces roridus]|uniref:Elongin-C n=1 Tax=Roridomyces roridus TaxID=1738132 RepID=A0AAD7BH12_9AGAR|nr:BTB/POZ protein [Roridomyces roridus]
MADVDMAQNSGTTAETDNDWVRVMSDDGYSFLVRRSVANASETMRDMLDTAGNYAEAIARTCPVSQRAVIVEKLLEYMSFKAYYEKAGPKEEVPVQEFMERIPPEIVLELLLAADYQNM